MYRFIDSFVPNDLVMQQLADFKSYSPLIGLWLMTPPPIFHRVRVAEIDEHS